MSTGIKSYVANGTIDVDDNQLIWKQFAVQIVFNSGADFKHTHPDMDLAVQTQYEKKILFFKIDTDLRGCMNFNVWWFLA